MSDYVSLLEGSDESRYPAEVPGHVAWVCEAGRPEHRLIIERFPAGGVPQHTLVSGGAASGKTWVAKLELSRWHTAGAGVVTIDYGGELAGLVERLGGSVVKLGDGFVINPLDFSDAVDGRHDALTEHLAFLEVFIELLVGDPNLGGVICGEVERKLFAWACESAYAKRGFRRGRLETQQAATSQEMPLLRDAAARLKAHGRDQQASAKTRAAANALTNALGRYVQEGPLASAFDAPTRLPGFGETTVAYSLFSLAPGAVGPVLALCIEHALHHADGNKRVLFIEGAQTCATSPASAAWLRGTLNRLRVRNVSASLMFSDFGVLARRGHGGQELIDTAAAHLALRPHELKLSETAQMLSLDAEEQARLGVSAMGEGLLVHDGERQWVHSAHSAEDIEYLLLSGG